MTIKDSSKHDWSKDDDVDVAFASSGGVREAITEAGRRGLVIPGVPLGHLRVVGGAGRQYPCPAPE
jgi:hypothetical protein